MQEGSPGSVDASDGGDGGTPGDAMGDALADAACPAAWGMVPPVDPLIALPDGGIPLILHAAGTGTQDFTCTATFSDAGAGDGGDGGTAGPTYGWTFVGPEAVLSDCTMAPIGHHFASDAGPTRPEWMETADNSFVIAKKVNNGYTPDSGAAIPWLLLQAVTNSDAGVLAQVSYVQRLNTTGGLTPAASTCGSTNLGASQKVGYTADYFFFGP
jgi:hypothetical protein